MANCNGGVVMNDDRLNRAIANGYGISNCVDLTILKQMTTRYEMTHVSKLDWNRVKWLHILGTEQNWPTELGRTTDNLEKGCYVDSSGSWLLLAGADAKAIRYYLNRCSSDLQRLFIGHTNLQQIHIPSFPALRKLHLVGNRELGDVYGIEELHSLQVLDLYRSRLNFVLNLTPYAELEELDFGFLKVRGIQLEGALQKLRKCQLRYADISDMSFLSNCPALEQLFLAKNPIEQIPEEIRKLKHLRMITLWQLSLKELPDWLPELGLTIGQGQGYGIDLQDTKVEDEYLDFGGKSQKTIAAWFEAQKQAKAGTPLNELKVVFLGDGSAGKTLTITRLLNDGAHPEKFDGKATPGIVIRDREYRLPDKQKVQVHFWDFGGQEILHSMHRIFLTNQTLYVVMINARNNTQDDQARYWLHNVNSFAPGCPVLLVLNQVDQNPNASVNERSLRRLYRNLKRVIRLSALTYDQETFNSAFTTPMLEQIAEFEKLREMFPPTWKAVMDQVRGMTGNYIRGHQYNKICRESGVDDQERRLELLKRFNEIGVSFSCSASPRLQDYVVLKPEWITNAIYTILWNKHTETTNGMVDQNEIYRLLTPEEGDGVDRAHPEMSYQLEDVDFVLGITRQFRLSFPMGNKEFMPMLCQANAVPDVDAFLDEPGVIEFRFEYEYLPNNVIHRLMVDMRRDLEAQKVWLTGAFFKHRYNGVRALVKSEGDVLSIYIRATDPEHRAHTYLNTLRSALDAIHEDMGLQLPETLVAYTESGKTEYFPYEVLEGSRQNGQSDFYSRAFRRMIPIDTILNGTDSQMVKKTNKLLRDIAKACIQLQNNRRMHNYYGSKYTVQEDDRNDLLRNALRNMGYHVSDQTHTGYGKTGVRAGSLDLQLLHEDNFPWTNLEAMNIKKATRAQLDYWDDHLNRLILNYDQTGLPVLFLVSYVDCAARDYQKLFNIFKEHMGEYAPPATELRHRTLSDERLAEDQFSYLRVTRCTYDHEGTPVTVYHYFVGFTLSTPLGKRT